MSKPKYCEWRECTGKSKIYVVLDGEKYWFCDHDHAEEFWESIQENY